MKKKTILELERVGVEDYRQLRKIPLTIVMDNVRSLNNIGSVFRTADAFRVERIMLCGISATPPSPEIHKTALGAEDSVAWSYFPTTEACLDALESEGVEVCCLEQVERSVSLEDFVPEAGVSYALVLGHEVEGVSQAVVDRAAHSIEIPQEGTKHSLNVAVAGALAMWHFYLALR